jgi:DNA-directed RNA polymerase subunit E'/Rpb7
MEIDKNLKETITKKIKKEYEGKCIVEGYIQKDSCQILSYSSGLIKGVNIIYDVVFKCKTCFPIEGMNINCIAINITKSAGIRAEIAGIKPSPAVIFITRDHHYNDDYFSQIKEGDTFSATVIGQRFELNDKFISIIAKLIQPSSEKTHNAKPKFVEVEELQIPKLPSKPPSKPPSKLSKVTEKLRIILSDDEDNPIVEEKEEEELVLVPKKKSPIIYEEENVIELPIGQEEVFEENENPDVEEDEFEEA